jgi:hypothetical protein
VRVGLCTCVTAAGRDRPVACMSVMRGLAPLGDATDGQRRDAGPDLAIRGKHPVVAVPMLARWREQKPVRR